MSSQYKLPVLEPKPKPQGAKDGEQVEADSTQTGRLLTLDQVRQQYPCDRCSAPCCSYLPLHTFTISTLRELDHALYILNFPRLELGLTMSGEWGVYYRYPCRFLDLESSLCSIYGDELRPRICVHYNPYSCWYKQVIGPKVHESFLRIDRQRADALIEHLTFDEHHNLIDTPDWPTMLSKLAKLPLTEDFDDNVGDDDPVFESWLYQAAYGANMQPMMEKRYSYTSLQDPCDGCGAYCCKYLVFPMAAPLSRSNLDFLQFVLGFPGLEIGVSDGDWFIIVRTTCRHLVDNRCGIYGKPERPHICTFYDASGCQYIAQFGTPRPADFMRLKLEQFFWFVELFEFDVSGLITYMPQTEVIRRNVEVRWYETVLAEAERVELEEATKTESEAS